MVMADASGVIEAEVDLVLLRDFRLGWVDVGGGFDDDGKDDDFDDDGDGGG